MKYIAALDYEHLDNGVFLTSVGRALKKQQEVRSVIVHGESEYTERLIQTGIMREEASIQCIKGLNHRLVALFADQGVATIGLNGYQRDLITLRGDELHLDKAYLDALPSRPVLLLSNLVLDAQTGKPTPVPLSRFIKFLGQKLSPDEIFLFSRSDSERPGIKPAQVEKNVPEEFKNLSISVRITTSAAFGKLPNLEGSVRFEN